MSIIEGRGDDELVARHQKPYQLWFNVCAIGGIVATMPRLAVFPKDDRFKERACASFKLHSGQNGRTRQTFLPIFCEVWNNAHHAHALLHKGQPVLVRGELRWKKGEERGYYSIRVEEFTLLWARPQDRYVLTGNTAQVPRDELMRLKVIERQWLKENPRG